MQNQWISVLYKELDIAYSDPKHKNPVVLGRRDCTGRLIVSQPLSRWKEPVRILEEPLMLGRKYTPKEGDEDRVFVPVMSGRRYTPERKDSAQDS
jgi:hypothetical protein